MWGGGYGTGIKTTLRTEPSVNSYFLSGSYKRVDPHRDIQFLGDRHPGRTFVDRCQVPRYWYEPYHTVGQQYRWCILFQSPSFLIIFSWNVSGQRTDPCSLSEPGQIRVIFSYPRLRIRPQFCVHWNDYKQVFVHEDIFGLLKTFKREEFFYLFYKYVYRINIFLICVQN